jgi:hypothetical protein
VQQSLQPLVPLVVLAVLACEKSDEGKGDREAPEPAAPLTEPDQLCRASTRGRPCRTPAQVESWLADPALEILGADEPPAGIQGARVLTLRLPRARPVVFRAKWRADYTTSSRNSPRRELAAYAVQKLFLEPGQHVVPPTAAHCFPLEMYRQRVSRAAEATFGEAPCVFGILSYWLEDVQSLADARSAGWFHGQYRHAFDPQLFASNPAYRDSISRVNMLTFLIGHADSHAKNFVITTDSAAPLVYSVDNSLSLGLRKNHKLDRRHDWSELKVPALPRSSVERLRAAARRLDRLAVVAELEPRGDSLVPVDAREADPTPTGVKWVDGRLLIGLTAGEIGDIEVRAALLLQWIRQGAIRLHGGDQ